MNFSHGWMDFFKESKRHPCFVPALVEQYHPYILFVKINPTYGYLLKSQSIVSSFVIIQQLQKGEDEAVTHSPFTHENVYFLKSGKVVGN